MTSLDPFLEDEYEEDDELSGGFPGVMPGSSQQSHPAHQYSSAPSSFVSANPNVYYAPPSTSFELPPSSFYGTSNQQRMPPTCIVQSPQQPQGGGFMRNPNQPVQYMFDPTMHPHGGGHQPQVYVMHHPNGEQQVFLQPAHLGQSSHQQQQQFQFEQHEVLEQQHVQQNQMPQQSRLQSANDHSYAAYNNAMGLYDDGSRDAHNFSPVERPPPRETAYKPSVGRHVARKRSAIEKRVGETDSASAAAVRRISTEEGWKSMNGWLKAAEQDTNRLLQLLGQCREAKVTVLLLRSNDTPKFIRKISKSHRDEEVRALSLSIVTKWKKVINTTDVVEEKKERKREEVKEEEEEDEEENNEMKVQTESMVARRSSDEHEKKKEVKKDKEHRAKAKVYQSKGRSTGLEGDDGAAPAKKRSVNDTSPSNGAPPAKKTMEKAAGVAAAPTTPPSKKVAAAPVRKVTASSSFMDSLLSPAAAAQPKKKVLPKRPLPRPDVKVARPTAAGGEEQQQQPEAPRGVIDMLLSPNADGKVAMEGLFADTSSSLKEDRVPSPPRTAAAPVVFALDESDLVVAGRRKIRFADEHGGELVETRYFEIEEGERINVNRFTPEEMKHYEAAQENKWMKDNSGMKDDDDEDDEESSSSNPWMMAGQNTAAGASTAKWRFIAVDADDRPEVEYGGQSQMRTIQEARQRTAMKAFCMPNERCSHFDEPENLFEVDPAAADAGLRLEPVMIPADLMPWDDDQEEIDGVAMEDSPVKAGTEPEQAGAAPVINDRLKALINGLKTQGLLHDGSAAAPVVNPLSVPPPGLAAPQIAQLQQPHQPVMIPTTSTYYQENGPPMNGGGGGGFPPQQQHPGRMHSIQQEFPGGPPPLMLPPGMPPPTGAAASSSGIQVVSMDVHGPNAGQMPDGPGGGDAPFPPYHPGPGRPFYVSHKPCTFFNSPRGCRFGDKCGFAHVVDPNGGGPPGPFRGGPMRGMRGEFRGGPPRGAFRGRGGGFGGPPMRDGPHPRDMDMRRGGGGWRDERSRDRRRSRSPSPSRRGDREQRGDRDREYRSSSGRRGEDTRDLDLRSAKEPRPRDEDDIDGVPIESPVA